MSGQMKVKSLSLSRRTPTTPRNEGSAKPRITEEEIDHISNLEAVLNSPIARPSRLCSTPIQKNVDFMEDSPDQDYRESPTFLFPCTQDSNEIAWDWQSGVKKEVGSPSEADKLAKCNSAALSSTPKRPQKLLPKKRAAKSYSPLLNVPNKRKLANQNIAESLGKFAAELSALAEKIKTEQDAENNERRRNGTEIVADSAPGTSEQPAIFDLKTQGTFDIHEVTTLEVSYVAEEKTDPEKPDSSLDDLFDDSVDACMVQCSQEVEEKLKLDSGGKSALSSTNGSKNSGCGASTSFANPNSGPKSFNVNIEREKAISKIPTKPPAENDIPASQIPDDSFDDCLALCLDEDDELMSKFLQDKKPQPKKAPDAGPTFKRKQQCMGPESAPATTQSRKFFKTKSLSDSYCDNTPAGKTGGGYSVCNSNLGQSYPPPRAKSGLNFNLSCKIAANGIRGKGSSASNLNDCASAAGGRSSSANNLNKPSSSNTVTYSYLRAGSSNLVGGKSGIGGQDPYSNYASRSEKPLKELRTTVPTSSQYNAEEIERKRLEAKSRLEANRLRNQMGSNKSGANGLQSKRPGVKR